MPTSGAYRHIATNYRHDGMAHGTWHDGMQHVVVWTVDIDVASAT